MQGGGHFSGLTLDLLTCGAPCSQLASIDDDSLVLLMEDRDLPAPNALRALVQASEARSLDIATFFVEKCRPTGDAWECQMNLGLGNALSVGIIEGVPERPSTMFGRARAIKTLVSRAPHSWPFEDEYSAHLEAALLGMRIELVPLPLLRLLVSREEERPYHEKYLRTVHSVWDGFMGRMPQPVAQQLWHMFYFSHMMDLSSDDMAASEE
jgi:hypothetical protein